MHIFKAVICPFAAIILWPCLFLDKNHLIILFQALGKAWAKTVVTAVSTLRTLAPRCIDLAIFAVARSTSKGTNPPSGPIMTTEDFEAILKSIAEFFAPMSVIQQLRDPQRWGN